MEQTSLQHVSPKDLCERLDDFHFKEFEFWRAWFDTIFSHLFLSFRKRSSIQIIHHSSTRVITKPGSGVGINTGIAASVDPSNDTAREL
jgi:hypothetical protein